MAVKQAGDRGPPGVVPCAAYQRVSQVGQALRALPWPNDVVFVAPSRFELDVGDADHLRRWLQDAERFDGILSVGAYTAVNRAESERALAWSANGRRLACSRTPRAMDTVLVHVSIYYVFNSRENAPYLENDPVVPLGVYVASKAVAEKTVGAAGARHAIARTYWVVSVERRNFSRTMLRLATEQLVVHIFADQHGASIAATNLNGALQRIRFAHLADRTHPEGFVYAANAGETKCHGVAGAIFTPSARMILERGSEGYINRQVQV